MYLKSEEELLMDDKSPFLEIATSEAERHGPERRACPRQGRRDHWLEELPRSPLGL